MEAGDPEIRPARSLRGPVCGGAVTEAGLLVYLLTIPAGPWLPTWSRDLALLAVLSGMVLVRIPMWSSWRQLPPFRFLVPMALFALSTLVSTIWSASPPQSLARAAYTPIALVLFFAIQEVAVTRAAYGRIGLVLAVDVVLLGVDGVYQFLSGVSLLSDAVPYKGRITGSLPHPNDLALIPILAPVSLALLTRSSSIWAKSLILGGFPFAVATVILSQSRNAWLGLAMGLGILLVFSNTRRWAVTAAAVAVAVFAFAYWFGLGQVPERVSRIFEATRDPRVALWLVAWKMFIESPLIGKGVHTFREFHLPYLEKIDLPAGIIRDPAAIPWAHNLYLEILAERGVLGMVGFGVPVLAMLVTLKRFLKREASPDSRMAALGLSASLAVFLVLGLFDLTFLKDWVLLVFCVLAGLTARLPMLEDADDAGRLG
jgi:putative inorganic carbon (HCO3(-)) transporter